MDSIENCIIVVFDADERVMGLVTPGDALNPHIDCKRIEFQSDYKLRCQIFSNRTPQQFDAFLANLGGTK